MNAKYFFRAVLPIVTVEVVLNLAHQYFTGDSDNSWFDWTLMGISFILFPFWAGTRVARISHLWYWWCIGGLCVMVGTVFSVAVTELFEPTLTEVPFILMLGSTVMLIPAYALSGFLGGKVALRYGAVGA